MAETLAGSGENPLKIQCNPNTPSCKRQTNTKTTYHISNGPKATIRLSLNDPNAHQWSCYTQQCHLDTQKQTN